MTYIYIFYAEHQNPIKGDWANQVAKDLIEMEIKLSYEEMKELSKESLKKTLKEVTKIKAFEWLMNEKEKLSKVKDIKFDELNLQEYLSQIL